MRRNLQGGLRLKTEERRGAESPPPPLLKTGEEMFTEKELRDILSAIQFDSVGTHGDERSQRLEKLEKKLKRQISKVKA
jgi:hypothetical protein